MINNLKRRGSDSCVGREGMNQSRLAVNLNVLVKHIRLIAE